MKVEVVAPEEFLGECDGQINSRRGNIPKAWIFGQACAG